MIYININEGSELTNKLSNFIIKRTRIKIHAALSSYNGEKADFLSHLLSILDKLVLAKPSEILEIIYEIENRYDYIKTDSEFKQHLLLILDYENLRRTLILYNYGAQFLHEGIKSCPYCNSHEFYNNESKQKLIFEFDHFLPKKIYPYLSVSLYNLIPSCHICNTTKEKKIFPINESYHPFIKQDQIVHLFHFKLINFDNAILYGKPMKIDYSLEDSDSDVVHHIDRLNVKNHINDFNLIGYCNDQSHSILMYIYALKQKIKNEKSNFQDDLEELRGLSKFPFCYNEVLKLNFGKLYLDIFYQVAKSEDISDISRFIQVLIN